MPHVEKDYEAVYLPDQRAGFVWDLSGGRLVISGGCPACAGPTVHPVPDVMPGAVTMGRRRRTAEETVPDEVYMQCRCLRAHAGDEQETGGCGAAWTAVRPAGAGA
ncbi:hypothetical protein D9753_17115 [Streptomyces dangxiongensis]|uniref:Uncharacterized protein n=1 Tax=Streptomyces dangxiongensis TaxID=1442032 RepID=A0A3G2JFD6_9ACTN|nr:hypothetical protein [Streptomyces dangxiongensis]AYN40341.1 hypothetical protein D9753_17115 [Streptomyces dangxiongensis]